MQRDLEGRIALVTGSARGIGAATAVALANAGANVIAVGRSSESLAETIKRIKEFGGKVQYEVCDLSKSETISGLAASVEQQFGKVDILVGNAAQLGTRPLLNATDLDDWDSVIRVNLTANMQLIRWFDPLLRKSDAARAIFMTAGSVHHPFAKGSAYTVAKAGLEALVRIYAVETEGTSVRVNAFNPGPIRTTMRATVAPNEDPMTLDTPGQVAERIVSICLPSVSVTGKLYSYPNKAFMDFSKPAPA